MELYRQYFVIGLLFTKILLPTVMSAVIGEPPQASEENHLPCNYRGNNLLHGETYIPDPCETVTCDNSILKIERRSCLPTFCYNKAVRFEGECCEVCPYYVPVYEVNAKGLNNITEGMVNNVVFDLNLMINEAGMDLYTPIKGLDLWKLSVWGSGSAEGEGERINYQEQVLTEDQAATTLIRRSATVNEGFEFNLTNISYSLDATDATCSQMAFLCYEFNQGDNPDPTDPRLNFTVEGVAGEQDSTLAPQNLRGCTRFNKCFEEKYLLPCSYRNKILHHGDHYMTNPCTTFTCDNSTIKVAIRSCPSVFCGYPVQFEDECCPVCPYYVPIYEVNARNLNRFVEEKVNDIIFDLNLKINYDGLHVTQPVRGKGLWKLSVWGSGSAHGDGERISFQEQVFTEEQAAIALTRDLTAAMTDGFEFNFTDIAYSLDATEATCPQMEFLCYEFNKGDNPEPKDPRLNFTVEGVAGEHDSTLAPQNLRGCTRFTKCGKEKSVSENNVQPDQLACGNIPEGQETNFVFDVRVAVQSAGTNEGGERSWSVNVLGVNVVTDGDNN